jgi:hypothetical protein
MVNLSPFGGAGAQFFDDNGIPLAGGLIYSYQAGTSTPQTTYTRAAGDIAHTNPIVLDAAGRVPTGEIWLTNGVSYKFVLKTADDVLIATYDNIDGINNAPFSQIATFYPNGSVTTFYLPLGTSVSTNLTNIFINGVYQNKVASYTVSNYIIQFSEAPPANSVMQVEY